MFFAEVLLWASLPEVRFLEYVFENTSSKADLKIIHKFKVNTLAKVIGFYPAYLDIGFMLLMS